MRKPILFITLRADFGGGPEHLWQLLRNMPAGMPGCVACPKEYPYYERYLKHVGEEHIFILPHRKFSLSALCKLRYFCRKHKVAVLHSHGKGAGLYSRILTALTGIPCVHTFHGVHMTEYGTAKKILYRLYERYMSLFTKAGIAVSNGERQQILTAGLMPEIKLHLVENGVVVPAMPAPPPITAQCPVVSITRFDYPKNNEFLIDIMEELRQCRRLQDFHFVIVGDGPGRSALMASTEKRGLAGNLKWQGATAEPHVFFAGALCYLSTSRWEGMPLAVLEAMAHGLPSVVTDVVGNRDVVMQEKTGFLYPEKDATAAAAFLCRLADEPNLRQRMGHQARAYVIKRHDVKAMAAATLSLLQDIASKSG